MDRFIQPSNDTYRLQLSAGGCTFCFQLRESFWHLDGTTFKFFDLKTPTIYGDRRRDTQTNIALANHFILRCFEQGVHESVDKQESYLLARLAPYMRPHASRRVLPDAAGTYYFDKRKTRSTAARELTAYLESSQGKQLTLAEFTRKTGDYLVMKGSQQQGLDYKRHKWKVLHPSTIEMALNAPEQGFEDALARWKELTKRRHSDEDERAALDALSYEARAAVRRCYAEMWRQAVDHLLQKQVLNEDEYRLHVLMHCELPVNYISPDDWSSTFHGHIFGLHPASGLLLWTALGRRLMKDVAKSAVPDGSFERFLYGLNLALHRLHEDHLEYQTSRRKTPQNESNAGNTEEIHARKYQVKKKRKPPQDE